MSPADVTINRSALTHMAHYADPSTTQKLFAITREAMKRLELGAWADPEVTDIPALVVIDPVGTLPSIHDIQAWLDSLHHVSDSESDSDSDDNSVDEMEFMSRVYTTVAARVTPTFKAATIAEQDA